MDVRPVLAPGEPVGYVRKHIPAPRHDRHQHPELELNLVVSGHLSYLVGSRRVDLGPRSLFWLFPGESHVLFKKDPEVAFYLGVWNPEFIRDLVGRGGPSALTARERPDAMRVLPLKAFRSLCALCDEVATVSGPGAPWAHGHLLFRAWTAFEAVAAGETEEVDPRVARAVRVMTEGEEDLSIEHMARGLDLTPDHLQKLFRKQMGLSLSDFREKTRLDRVARLMEGRNTDLTAAALAAGFGSYSAFHRAFRRNHGVSPREFYRRVEMP